MSRRRAALAALLIAGAHLPAFAEGTPAIESSGPAYALETLRSLSKDELRGLFETSLPGELPSGIVRGTVVRLSVNLGIKRLILNQLWAGKNFYPQEGAWEEIAGKRYFIESTLHNIVAGANAFKGQVYKDVSWLDGKPCWVIEYRKTSPIIGYIRDEFRHVGNGLYLGWTFDQTADQNGVAGRRAEPKASLQSRRRIRRARSPRASRAGRRYMLNFAIDSKPAPAQEAS